MTQLRVISWATVLVVGFQVSASRAADPTGTWKWERTRNDRTMTSVLTLQAKGDSLTGSYTGRRGEPVKIEKGKIDGDMISFQLTFERNDNKFVIQYRGKVSDDRITGKIEFTRGGEARGFDWKAIRVIGSKDVVGTWLFKVERDNDNIIETRLEVTQADGKLKGVYTSRNRERDVKEITLSEGKLRFVVAGEREGNAFSFIYNGKITGNKMKGKVDYDFNDNTGTLDFTGLKKVAPSVAGTWVFKIELDNGNILEPQLVLTQDADKFKGVYTSRDRELDVKEITVKDGRLRFVVTGETDEGSTFSDIYKGKIADDKIGGQVDYEFNDESGSLDFTGRKKVTKD